MQTNFNIAPVQLNEYQAPPNEGYHTSLLNSPFIRVVGTVLVLSPLSACGEGTEPPTYNNTNLASAPHNAPATLSANTRVVFEAFENEECKPRRAAAGPYAGMVVRVAPADLEVAPSPTSKPSKTSTKPPSPSPKPAPTCEDAEVQFGACQGDFTPDLDPETTALNCVHFDVTPAAFEAAGGPRWVADNQSITLRKSIQGRIDKD